MYYRFLCSNMSLVDYHITRIDSHVSVAPEANPILLTGPETRRWIPEIGFDVTKLQACQRKVVHMGIRVREETIFPREECN